MADKIVISGIRPYDGEWDLDMDAEPFTTLEWRWIKKISGYLPMTLEEGFRGGDPDIFISLAVIALFRAGKFDRDEVLAAADLLADAPFDGSKISFVGAQSPPVEESTPESLPAVNGQPAEPNAFSGDASTLASART